MADKILRPNAEMPIFANGSVAADVKEFGTANNSKVIEDVLTNTNAIDGWSSGVDVNGFPAKEWFNAIGWTLSYITSLYLQDGITDWNTNQSYYTNSQAKSPIDGFTYISKTGTAPSTPNPGTTDPSIDGTNWRLAFLDSANTVAFTPTSDTHPATKKYVDDTKLAIASTAEAQAGTDNTKTITPLRLREGLNATGSAPIFAVRAWVNFNGTGVIAINASGNVSSLSDLGVGRHRVNYLTAIEDADYEISGFAWQNASLDANAPYMGVRNTTNPLLTTSASMHFQVPGGAAVAPTFVDCEVATVHITR